MLNAKTHMLIGVGVSATATLLDKSKYSVNHPITIAPVVGAFMERLPEILEIAINPNRRQFSHGLTAMTLLSTGLLKAYRWSPEDPFEKFVRGLMLIGGVAYLSHVVCDSSKPKGFPLLGKL